MRLFSRKPQVSVQRWCDEFYSFIFEAIVRGVDPWQAYCAAAHKQLVEVAPAYADADGVALAEQLRAMQLEAVGIAWMLKVEADLSPRFNQCTHEYLKQHGRNHYWELMEPYNQTVAESTVGGRGPAHIASMNVKRADAFDRWTPTVSDPTHAARAANRIGCAVEYKSTRLQSYMGYTLGEALGYEAKGESNKCLGALAHGFITGALDELRKVKIIH